MVAMSNLQNLKLALDQRFDGSEGLEELETITTHGMSGGVSGFIYSTELAEFFDKHESAIEETVTDMNIRLENLVKDSTSWTCQEVKESAVWLVVEEYANLRVADELEPSDQEMMAAFGTKWHDGL